MIVAGNMRALLAPSLDEDILLVIGSSHVPWEVIEGLAGRRAFR